MSRSLKVAPEFIPQVKAAVKRQGYPRQKDLADELQLCLATVNNYLNGKAVDNLNFQEISERLEQDWEAIAIFEDTTDRPEEGQAIDPLRLDSIHTYQLHSLGLVKRQGNQVNTHNPETRFLQDYDRRSQTDRYLIDQSFS
ncbi:hypothetical protein [Roseofilum capinflatum]|uniref:XRE family transcriptional regulator n=1 Tax=Roseofilum capinflatum BLCC-M114 TaxID=3022440 RepID=A0ABT7B7L0_9CYAN|nr:hypothetical protein [Roseofilum capinflatum]MDJ1174278.1 hypothetical protein [Roseofilum capinflatum BLCC-M114]